MPQEGTTRSPSVPPSPSAHILLPNDTKTGSRPNEILRSTAKKEPQARTPKTQDPISRRNGRPPNRPKKSNPTTTTTTPADRKFEIWKPSMAPGDDTVIARDSSKGSAGVRPTNPLVLTLQRLGTGPVDEQPGQTANGNGESPNSAVGQSSFNPSYPYAASFVNSDYESTAVRTWHDWLPSPGTHRPSPPHLNQEQEQTVGSETHKVETIDENRARRSIGTDVAIALIRGILSNKLSYKALLSCRGDKAQKVLDRLQELLYNPLLTDEAFKNHLLTAILRLCNTSGMYPQCLTLRDIQHESDPVTAGHFGEIRRGSFRNQLVCLKVVKLYQKSQIDHLTKRFTCEAILWSQLNHPNLLPFYGIYKLGDTNGRICLVSPWMENGNISEYLNENPEASRMRLVYEIVAGLVHLHVKKIAHGDLKGTNIMITSTGSACLADFGLSSVADADILRWTSLETATRAGGTTRWLAPELLEEENSKLIKPTLASGVYALASVMYEVFTDKVPFYEYPREATVIFKIVTGVKPSQPTFKGLELTNRVWELMEPCWSFYPADRPTIANFSKALQQIPLKKLSKIRMEKIQRGPNRSSVMVLTPTSFQAAMYHGERTRVDFSESDLKLLEELISGESVEV